MGELVRLLNRRKGWKAATLTSTASLLLYEGIRIVHQQ